MASNYLLQNGRSLENKNEVETKINSVGLHPAVDRTFKNPAFRKPLKNDSLPLHFNNPMRQIDPEPIGRVLKHVSPVKNSFSFTIVIISGLQKKIRETDDEFAMRFLETVIDLLQNTIFDNDDSVMIETENNVEFLVADDWAIDYPIMTVYDAADTAEIEFPHLGNENFHARNVAEDRIKDSEDLFYDSHYVQLPNHESQNLPPIGKSSLLSHSVDKFPFLYRGCIAAEHYKGGFSAAKQNFVIPKPFQSAIIRRKAPMKASYHNAGLPIHRLKKQLERTVLDVWIPYFQWFLVIVSLTSFVILAYLDGRTPFHKISHPSTNTTDVLLCNVFLLEQNCICWQEEEMAIQVAAKEHCSLYDELWQRTAADCRHGIEACNATFKQLSLCVDRYLCHTDPQAVGGLLHDTSYNLTSMFAHGNNKSISCRRRTRILTVAKIIVTLLMDDVDSKRFSERFNRGKAPEDIGSAVEFTSISAPKRDHELVRKATFA